MRHRLAQLRSGQLARIGATVLAGAAAAFLAKTVGLPLPWLLAPLLTIGALSLAGLPTAGVPFGRRAGQLIIGTAIGLYLAPEVVAEMVRVLPVMLAAAVLSIAISIIIAMVATARAGLSFATAYFAFMPGGVAEMAGLGRAYGADDATVAVLQSLRIATVVTIVAPAVALLAAPGAPAAGVALPEVHLLGLVAMLSAALVIAVILSRLSVPNAWMLGGLAVGAATAALALPLSGVPTVLVSLGQLLVGCALGTRFTADLIRGGPRLLLTGLVLMIALIAGGALLAIATSLVLGAGPAVLFLATAPGGITEMSITAKLTGLPVPIVVAFHLVRIVTVVVASAVLYRFVSRRYSIVKRA